MKRSTVILLAIFCTIIAPILVIMMNLQALFGNVDRAQKMALALDECGNALFGGDPRMSISGRTGNGVILGYQWAKTLAPVIDFLFGKGHCVSSATLKE
jgi:hypothetical protein